VTAKQGRKAYVLDRTFQLRHALMLAAAGALLSGVFGAMAYALTAMHDRKRDATDRVDVGEKAPAAPR